MDINTIKLLLMIFITVFFIVLMMKKKMSAILALPLMGISVAVIAAAGTYPMMGLFDFVDPNTIDPVTGEPMVVPGIFQAVVADGAKMMASAISAAVFGAALAKLLQKANVVETIVKKAAELAGDKQMGMAIIFFIASTIIFMGLGGIGTVIVVGSIMLPIMITAGIRPVTAAMVLLFGLSCGGVANPQNFATFTALLEPIYGAEAYNVIVSQTLPIFIIVFVISLAGIIFNVKKEQYQRNWAVQTDVKKTDKHANFASIITPIIPVILIFWGTFAEKNMPVEVAIMISIVWLLLVSGMKNKVQATTQAFVEGAQDVAGVVVLLIGLGILIKGFQYSAVAPIITPAIEVLISYLQNPMTYVIGFTLATPLVLYRGPLNTFGIGGALPVIFASASFNPAATVYALRATGNMQGFGDPTNSHNIWTADFVKVDVNDILKKVFVWGMLMSFFILAYAVFFEGIALTI